MMGQGGMCVCGHMMSEHRNGRCTAWMDDPDTEYLCGCESPRIERNDPAFTPPD